MPNYNNYKKEQKEENAESPKYSMATVLGSKTITSLMEALHLTEKQKLQATTTALELSTSATLYKCDQISLAKYCLHSVRYGFTRPDCIYPVPYNNYVQAQLGYRGYKELAMRSGLYKQIDSVEVLSCDKLHRDRITGKITVEFEEDVNKTLDAKPIGYYAYAIDHNGELIGSVYWSKEKCEEHGHQYSQSYNSVWGKSFSKMATKTVMKQLLGQLPTTPEIQEAIKQDQIVYGGDGEEDTYRDNPYNNEPEYTDSEVKEETEIIDVKDSEQPKEENGEVSPGEFLKNIGYDVK